MTSLLWELHSSQGHIMCITPYNKNIYSLKVKSCCPHYNNNIFILFVSPFYFLQQKSSVNRLFHIVTLFKLIAPFVTATKQFLTSIWRITIIYSAIFRLQATEGRIECLSIIRSVRYCSQYDVDISYATADIIISCKILDNKHQTNLRIILE